jgi:hypothetical protein
MPASLSAGKAGSRGREASTRAEDQSAGSWKAVPGCHLSAASEVEAAATETVDVKFELGEEI